MQTQTQTDTLNRVVTQTAQPPAQRENFIVALASNFGMTAKQFWDVVKNTVFKDATDAECNALLMVAHEYKLNPILKEIYAFRTKSGGIMPMVPIDGWISLVNRNPLFAGYETTYPSEEQWIDRSGKKCPPWVEVTMYRRDSDRAYPHREYMDECYLDTGPWKSHPKRMLKHKAFIQSARYALGIRGVYDEDEARGMIDVTPSGYEVLPSAPDTSAFDALAADVADDPQFQAYLAETAKANGMALDAVKVEVAKDFDAFVAGFRGWAEKQNAKPKTKRKGTEERIAAAEAALHPEVVTESAQEEQHTPQGQPETILCPNRLDSDANMVPVLLTVCEACKDKPTCPQWEGK